MRDQNTHPYAKLAVARLASAHQAQMLSRHAAVLLALLSGMLAAQLLETGRSYASAPVSDAASAISAMPV